MVALALVDRVDPFLEVLALEPQLVLQVLEAVLVGRGADPLNVLGEALPVGADLVEVGQELGEEVVIRPEQGAVYFFLKNVLEESSLDILTVIADEARGEALDDKVRHTKESKYKIFMIKYLYQKVFIPRYF